jgi:hypothetical protein
MRGSQKFGRKKLSADSVGERGLALSVEELVAPAGDIGVSLGSCLLEFNVGQIDPFAIRSVTEQAMSCTEGCGFFAGNLTVPGAV